MTSNHRKIMWIEEDKIKKIERLAKELMDLERENDLIEKIARLKRKNNGCFISTACVEAKGLPDDCLELQTLREFRDNILIHLSGGIEAIEEYYAEAPGIVIRIYQREDRKRIFTGLYDGLVRKTADLIIAGKHEQAFNFYKDKTAELKATYS